MLEVSVPSVRHLSAFIDTGAGMKENDTDLVNCRTDLLNHGTDLLIIL